LKARRLVPALAAAPLAVLLAACSSGSPATTSTTTSTTGTTTTTSAAAAEPTTIPASEITTSTTTNQTVGMPASALDLAAIPLGSDKSTTTPKAGYLDRCGGTPSGGPPVSLPPWVDTATGTWNATTKVAVAGHVTWNSSFSATRQGSEEVFKGNGLPPLSGTFPVATSDPAHAYNPDPTAVEEHTIDVSVPYNPVVNAQPTCESGVVGIAIDGIPILDGYDAAGNDAAAVETQDVCHGHPNQNFGYHYHSLSPCILSTQALTHTTLVGWALDGFGIYVEYNSQGQLLTDSDLDACHGRTSVVPWHGKMVDIYHYDMTFEFPYTVGCFRGTPSGFAGMTIDTAGGGGGPPPPS
jgi:hypothetical protein